MNRDQKNLNAQGFTLIEMILAITIFSLIALSLYSVFSGGLSISQVIDKRVKGLRETRWIFDRLGSDLDHIVRYDLEGSYKNQTAFKGAAKEISFFRSTGKGLKAVRYSLKKLKTKNIHTITIGEKMKKNERVDIFGQENTNLKMALVREEVDLGTYLSASFADENKKQDILSTRIFEDQINFFFEAPDGRWLENWTTADLPAGVRMEFRPTDGNDQKQIDLVRDYRIYIEVSNNAAATVQDPP